MHHGGKLLLRDYHILDNEECRKRMERVEGMQGSVVTYCVEWKRTQGDHFVIGSWEED